MKLKHACFAGTFGDVFKHACPNPEYAAPEIMAAFSSLAVLRPAAVNKVVDGRANNVWSLACVILEINTNGYCPFGWTADTTVEMQIAKHSQWVSLPALHFQCLILRPYVWCASQPAHISVHIHWSGIRVSGHQQHGEWL